MLLALDPGTKCGWAVLRKDGSRVASGVWRLPAGKRAHPGDRYRVLELQLTQALARWPGITHVALEDVRRHAGTIAAHVYGGLRATISMQAARLGLPLLPQPVGRVKRLATGSGAASKTMMVEAFRAQLKLEPQDDNEADAYFVGRAALAELSGLAA